MLNHSFIHVPGVGEKTEKVLWQNHILTWSDALCAPRLPVNKRLEQTIRKYAALSQSNQGNAAWFAEKLPSRQSWRMFQHFQDHVVYLDIETNGGWGGFNEITVIGLYDGADYQSFVSGWNLEAFETALEGKKLMVTFNGARFDLPVIRACFPHAVLPPAHIDLCPAFSRLGLSGGLKRIERTMGLARAEEVEGLDGMEAVRLWNAWQWGNRTALDRLIQYNREDVVNLEPLMKKAYKSLLEKTWQEAQVSDHGVLPLPDLLKH